MRNLIAQHFNQTVQLHWNEKVFNNKKQLTFHLVKRETTYENYHTNIPPDLAN